MDLPQAISLLKDLKKFRVKIVEFTGGDITAYLYLKEVLLNALDLDFEYIALLTNGVVIKDDIMDIILQNKSKVVVQIDLHSLDNVYLEWFSKVPGILDKVKRNIERLACNGVKVRVASIVTQKNLHEIDKIAEWAYNVGSASYTVGPVINLGRGEYFQDGLYIKDEESLNILNKKLIDITKKFGNFLVSSDKNSDFIKRNNCGCLTSNITITPSGDIKFCTMDNTTYFNSCIGNVFTKNIKEIYDENSDYINQLFNVDPPKFESDECKECENRYFCSNCLLRGFIKAKEIGESCKWYMKKVSKPIKERLLS